MRTIAPALLLLTCLSVCSQPRIIIPPGSNLIYSFDGNNGNTFLIPYLETLLKELKFANTNLPIFDSVHNLNLLLSQDKTNFQLLTAFNAFDRNRTEIVEDQGAKEVERKIASVLKTKQFFFQISINTLNTLIEYQFTLFKINKAKAGVGGTDPSTYRTTSIFVDPTTLDYKDKIRYAIKEIIFEANEAPDPILLYEGREVQSVLYVQRNSVVNLTASYTDRDSPEDKIKYDWSIVDTRTKMVVPNLFHKNQSFKADDILYYIKLTANDGISEKTKSFTIYTQPKSDVFYKTFDESFWDWDYTKKQINFYSFSKTFDEVVISSSLANSAKVESKLEASLKFSAVADSIRLFFVPGAANFLYTDSLRRIQVVNCSQNTLNIQPFCITPLSSSNPIIREFQLGLRNGTNPASSMAFIIDVYKNSIVSSDNFTIAYRKLSRVMPRVDFAYLKGSGDSVATSAYAALAGVDVWLGPALTLNPMLSISRFTKSANSPSDNPRFGFRVNALATLYTANWVRLDFGFSYLNHPVYSTKLKDHVYTVGSAGFGIQLKFMPNYTTYMDLFEGYKLSFFYYGHDKSGIASGMNAFQIGLRTSIVLLENRKRQ